LHIKTTTRQDDQRRYAWRLLSVTSIGVLLAGANTSTLDVGLPVVARHFQASATAASWTLLSYMLFNTVFILVLGRMADIVGRKRLYLMGLGTLTLASLACGLAPNIIVLDGLRAIQGIGAAAIITNTTAQLTDAFPSDILGIGLGLNVTVVSAAQVIGPVLGGLLATSFGWQAVFWFNVPTGLIGLGWAIVSLRRPLQNPTGEQFDFAGALLSLLALSGVVVALSEGGALGWTSVPVIVGGMVFLTCAPMFVLVQMRRANPLVDLSLFGERERSMAYVAGFLLSLARFAVVLLMSLYLQAAQGLDPFDAGLRVIPVAVGMMIVSPIAGRLTRRYSARVLSSLGLMLTAAGLILLGFVVAPTTAYDVVAIGLLAVGIGSGLFLTPNTRSIMAGVSEARRGIANGVRSMVQNGGYVVSIALSLGIVTSSLAPADKHAAYSGTLSKLSGDTLASFTRGYHIAFFVLAGVSALGVVASLSRRSSPDPHAEGLDDIVG
jgi:EmrB/QacA subfamily drug resistance transporter